MPINDELSHQQWSRFQWCRDRGHLDFIAKADKCDNFFVGNQWLQEDLNALELAKRPALTINKILSTLSTIFGEQIQNRTEVLFRPQNGAPAEVADALSKVWMQIAQNNQLQWIRSDVFADGMVRSRGFYDVRLDFNDSMQGEVRISQLNSKNVVVDPDAEEYDPDHWNDVFITKWLTHQDIAILYSEDDAEYLKNKEGSSFPYGYDSIERVRDRFAGSIPLGGYYGLADDAGVRRNIRVLERQYRMLDKQLHFVDVKSGDMRPVPEDWDREKIAALLDKTGGAISTTKKLVKRIRWTVTADNVVLHDDWSPYKHFTVVPYFPFFRYGKTVGAVENLISPQEILNKASSQELHVINTTANSGWTIEENSLVNMSVEELELSGAKTGLVLEYRKGSQPPEKIAPNQVPSGLDRVTFKAEEHIKTISGVSDSMQGFDREDVAAKAIAYKQQRGSVNMSKPLDNLGRSDWLLARNVLDLVQNYYTEERLVTITHDDPAHEQESITINQYDPVTGAITNDLTLGEYDIVITNTPARASLEDSQFEQARALKELGVQIPDSVLIENSRLQRRNDLIKQLQAAQQSPEAQQQQQLQLEGLEADVALKQAQAQKTAADAGKAHADTAIKSNEAQMGPGAELAKMREEMRMEQERLTMELEKMRQEMLLKQQEMEMKLEMQRQDHQMKQAMKVDEHHQDMRLREQQAEQQAEAQRVAALRGESESAKTPANSSANKE